MSAWKWPRRRSRRKSPPRSLLDGAPADEGVRGDGARRPTGEDEGDPGRAPPRAGRRGDGRRAPQPRADPGPPAEPRAIADRHRRRTAREARAEAGYPEGEREGRGAAVNQN